MNLLIVSQALLWVMVLLLGVVVLALTRQLGILYQRIAPVGALAMNQGMAGGDAAPSMLVTALDGRELRIAGASSSVDQQRKSQLLFFLSPTCPICKELIPAVLSIRRRESKWLEVVFASDGGSESSHRDFVVKYGLDSSCYVLSEPLGRAFAVGQLPYGVLIDGTGTIAALGIVNSREHLDSLFEARRLGKATIQDYFGELDAKQLTPAAASNGHAIAAGHFTDEGIPR